MTILKSLAVLISLALVTAPLTALRAADVTINTSVPAPQVGQGGLFTVTTTGTISGGGNGIEAGNTNETRITALEVLGRVDVTGYALNVADGAVMNEVINRESGVMSGDRVIQTYGTTEMGLITNFGTMSATGYGVLLYGPSTGFVNEATGVLTATSNDAVYLIGPTTVVGNSGTITAGGLGVYVHSQLDFGVNQGTIQSGNHGVFVNGGALLGQLTNTGTITSNAHGVQNSGTIGAVGNSGLITGFRGLQGDPGSSFQLIQNSGTVRGSDYGMVLYSTIDSLENLTGGLIEATTNADGIYHEGTTTTLTNGGRIAGARYGVFHTGPGTITTLTNAGTIEGGTHGVQNSGAIGTVGNTGLITGVRGLQADSGSSFTTLSNSGTVRGSDYGMVLYATTGTLENLTGGLIEATTNTDGIYHEGTTTTFTNGGQIIGARNGVLNTGAGTLSAITNTGTITGNGEGAAGLQLNAATTTTSLTNSGNINGAWGVSQNAGTITTLTNSGTLYGSGGQGDGVYVNNGATIGSLVNQAGGRIEGNNMAVQSESTGAIGSIDNAGTITGWWGIYSAGSLNTFVNRSTGVVQSNGFEAFASGAMTSFTNEAGGTISASGYTGVVFGGDVGTVANAGTISGNSVHTALQVYAGTVGTLTNTGTITGGYAIENYGAITTLNNSGSVVGAGFGIYSTGSLGELTNSGTVQGSTPGMMLSGTTGSVSNLAGGRIASTFDDGVYVSGAVTSLANAGTLAGGTGSNDSGLELAGSGTIGTLTNTGVIGTTNGYYGIYTRDSSGIGSIVNSGTIQSYYYAINHEGNTITSLVNQAGGLIKSYNSNAVGGGGIGSIDNSGTIEGDSGIRHNRSPLMGTITNRSGGVIRGTYDAAIYTDRGMTSITNEAGGLIESTAWHGISLASEVPTITNAGTIRTTYSSADGIRNTYAMANLTNSGTIQGGTSGRGLALDEVTGTVTNTATGLIEGGRYGYYVGDDTNAIVNAGQFRGGDTGIYAGYAVTSLVNQAGGVISGTSRAGIKLEDTNGTITNQAGGRIESANGDGINVGGYGTTYVTGTIANAGTIEGGTSGVQVTNGRLHKLTNSGTIAYTGQPPTRDLSGTGPAVFVGTGGVLGDATGAGGVALSSTGAGALLDGTIVNQGTIHYGFEIANQDVTVSADGGAGTFTNGLLDVVDGNLTFTGGKTTLDANVSVNGGTGTVFNEAVLAFTGARNFDGAFSQTSAGTLSSLISGESTYGSIIIDGAAAFAGTLDLDLVGGFDFAEDQTFDLFTFVSRTGGFTGLSVDGVALASAGTGQWTYDSLILEEQWTGTSMSIKTLAPVPEPSTYAMALAGLACGGYLVRRRRKRA